MDVTLLFTVMLTLIAIVGLLTFCALFYIGHSHSVRMKELDIKIQAAMDRIYQFLLPK